MGVVFRAQDERTGATVALKLEHGAGTTPRFEQESRALSRLTHPNVVGFVGSGDIEDVGTYLAMEWIDGGDLDAALRRGTLTLDQALQLIRGCAEGLVHVHQLGIIHRDIKPGNILLRGGDPAQPVLVDFGVAHLREANVSLTQTGDLIGTPAYMAPEQARGKKTIDARADLYACGAVLFRALTGELPFSGPNVLAVLAKVLLEEAPRLSTRMHVPMEVDSLAARLLARDPRERPADAATVVALLDALLEARGASAPAARDRPSGLEVTMVAGSGDIPGSLGDAATMLQTTPAKTRVDTEVERRVAAIVVGRLDEHATLPVAANEDRLRARIKRANGELARLADGSWLVLVAEGAPRDLAARAVHCAQALRDLVGARVGVALGRAPTGRADASDAGDRPADRGSVLGDAVDRASQLSLRTLDGIAIDEHCQPLLQSEYHLVQREAHVELGRARGGFAFSTDLLGRETPHVGRRRDLAILGAALDDAIDEQTARAVLVLGEAGMGKSRLSAEWRAQIKALGEPVEVLIAQAELVPTGKEAGMLAPLVLERAGVHAEMPGDEALAAVLQMAERDVGDPGKAAFVGPLLAQLAGLGSDASTQNDTASAADLRAAFETWLLALSQAQPLVLILEDLHWADSATLDFVRGLLEAAPDGPIVVAGFARPSLFTGVRDLAWMSDWERIELRPLSNRAALRVARAALGSDADAPDDATLASLVAHAGGHPLMLEELVRAFARGDELTSPTVEAMLDERIARLPSSEQLLLRAASVCGEASWPGALHAVLSNALSPAEVAASAASLVEGEVLRRDERSRYASSQQFAFRHALLRDAAYASTPPGTRAQMHGRFADWLASAGGAPPHALADHLWLAERYEEGARYQRKAASALLAEGAGDDASARAQRVIDAGLGDARTQLILGRAAALGGRRQQARTIARELVEASAVGSDLWYDGLTLGIRCADRAEELTQHIAALDARRRSHPYESGPQSRCVARAIRILTHVSSAAAAEEFIEYAEGFPADHTAAFPAHTQIALDEALSMRSHRCGDHYDAAMRAARRIEQHHARLHSQQHGPSLLNSAALSAAMLGAYDSSCALLDVMASVAGARSHPDLLPILRLNQAHYTMEAGDLVKALEHAEAAVAVASEQESVLVLGVAKYVHAMVLFRTGDRPAAAALLERALGRVAETSVMWRTIISGWLGYALSGLPGRHEDALRHSEFAVAALEEHGGWEEEATIRLGLIYSLERSDRARAKVELERALRLLGEMVERMPEPYYRWTIRQQCSGHVELIAHAVARGVALPQVLEPVAEPLRPDDFYTRCLTQSPLD